MSTGASKKHEKDIAITQVAPQQPVNKYGLNADHGLDNDKESTSKRNLEDTKSERNSKSEDEKQHIKSLAELKRALQDKLDEKMKKNGDLGDKITQPQKTFFEIRNIFHAYDIGVVTTIGDFKAS
ncbi:ankyrin repeat domain-containing protein 26-like isoform X2 [Lepus europaeus]|uniref:ankyrin repeat domain-containing protein 26-like isoform X2 n=1 Tax=Lepus europaeus TaxID=9983 RepID=UPI002B46C430|nr:ankyrin repeat domain-containing protein 26-like isoform X2 [Lepus europaeus]